MPDDSLYLVERIKRMRAAVRELENAPPGNDIIDSAIEALTGSIRDDEGQLRFERVKSLEMIAVDLVTAATRIKLSIALDDLGDGTRFSDLELQDLGTLFGHFDRAWEEIPTEWKVS